MLSQEDLLVGHVYRIVSRNLDVAVYQGKGAFTGLREKFGRVFLGTEWLGTYGTVRAVLEDLGPVPTGMPLGDHVPITDPVIRRQREAQGRPPWVRNVELERYLRKLESDPRW